MTDNGLITDSDGLKRCFWCGSDAQYILYHDEEWGKPVHDDVRLFEKICLESFQAGLSWLTILRKRENFRAAFDGFDFAKIAEYGDDKVNILLQNKGIVRHRGKIEATINNANRALALIEEKGSLSNYFWSFAPPATARPQVITYDILMQMSKTPESITLSKDLKNRGWKFVGPTTVYAFMQAMGMVNDHIDGCCCARLN